MLRLQAVSLSRSLSLADAARCGARLPSRLPRERRPDRGFRGRNPVFTFFTFLLPLPHSAVTSVDGSLGGAAASRLGRTGR